MDTINEIKSKLNNYDNIKYICDNTSITVKSQNKDGFDVGLYINPENKNTFTVYYNGWHEHFENKKEAIQAFMFGLTNRCRLKVEHRGVKAFRWILEYKKDGNWIKDSIVGSFINPFWKRKTIKLLQNDII